MTGLAALLVIEPLELECDGFKAGVSGRNFPLADGVIGGVEFGVKFGCLATIALLMWFAGTVAVPASVDR